MHKEEIKLSVNKIWEMIYWLYQKDIKANITKEKIIPSLIIKKKVTKNYEPNLFNY